MRVGTWILTQLRHLGYTTTMAVLALDDEPAAPPPRKTVVAAALDFGSPEPRGLRAGLGSFSRGSGETPLGAWRICAWLPAALLTPLVLLQ